MLKKTAYFLLLAVLAIPPARGQTGNPSSLEMIFTGDIMGHDSQIASAWNASSGRHEYDTCFAYLRRMFLDADLVVGNLEVTLAGEPYKGYPRFSSPDALGLALKKSGFNVLVQANNHACDRGQEGLERTAVVLDLLGIHHTGTFRDREDRNNNHPLFLEKKGFRIALLNYTYGTNGLEVTPPNIVNLSEREQMCADLEKARLGIPDAIIVCIHWGTEYETLPNKEQKDLAGFLFGHGADIIIGTHPHVIQPMERYAADNGPGERIVAWSLGNFISNQRNRGTDGGAVLRIRLEKDGDRCRITLADYLLTWVYTPRAEGKREFYVLPAVACESDTSLLRLKEDQEKLMLFLDDSRNLLGKYNRNVPEMFFTAEEER